MTPRLAVVTSHPIQYQAPLWRTLAARGNVELEVFFLSDHGLEPSFDAGLGRVVRFDVPLTEGYASRVVRNRSPRPSIATFFGSFHPELPRAIVRGRFDAVMVLGYAKATNWLVFAVCRLRGIPLVLRGEAPDPPPERRHGLKWQAKRLVLRQLVRSSAACVAIGLRNARYYVTMGARPDRLFWAPYSVDDESFRAGGELGRAERAERLRELGLDPDTPTLLFAAKFIPLKRPYDVIDAVERLGGRVQLLMVGDGPLFAQVEQRVGHHPYIRLLGFVNQSEIAAWYGVADLFVLASDRETWGLVVNEAIAGGAVPVVSDAVGCAPDLVDGGAGRIFPAGDVDALAACLEELLSPEARQAARAEGERRIGRYSLARTAAGIEEAVAAVSGRRS